MITNLYELEPRSRVIYLAVALSIAVDKNRYTEARHLKKKLDESWRLHKQERDNESNENRPKE